MNAEDIKNKLPFRLDLAGKELVGLKTFTQRDGTPVIRVLKARKIPAGS